MLLVVIAHGFPIRLREFIA